MDISGHVKSAALIAGLSSTLLFSSGCATYLRPTSDYRPPPTDKYYDFKCQSTTNKLYDIVPLHHTQIKWYDAPHWFTWTMFGNQNDGIFGDLQKVPYTTNLNVKGFASWWCRNPMHNLTFHVLGSDWMDPHVRFTVFGVEGSSIRALQKDPMTYQEHRFLVKLNLNDYKPYFHMRIPVTMKRDWTVYLGWRYNGALGGACRLGEKYKPKIKKQQNVVDRKENTGG